MPIHSFRVLLHQPAVQTLIAAAEGVELHLVGGVLRDRALGLPVHDVDAVVSGQGKEIAERLASILPARLVLLGGKEFAAYRLVGEDMVVDLWDRAGTSLHQDLARRDFTINSFAFDLRSEEVSDPFGGIGDLGRRVLRATTEESFRATRSGCSACPGSSCGSPASRPSRTRSSWRGGRPRGCPGSLRSGCARSCSSSSGSRTRSAGSRS